jgi:chemotaxis protein CheD
MKAEPRHMTRSDRIYIGQGEIAVDGGEDVIVYTLLGSCVSACIWDPDRGIGGMNHVLFVDNSANAASAFGHGVNGMELLINGLLRRGGSRGALRAKVFGGARMVDGLSDHGARNGAFVCEYLDREGIPLLGSDLGGVRARRIEFWPANGRAKVKYLKGGVAQDTRPAPQIGTAPELF